MNVARINKKECSGCNACAEICPKGCIKMEPDLKGFLYPRISVDICINCGLCKKVCPLQNDNIKNNEPVTAYAAWCRETEVYKTSSSGGAAYIFSTYILNHNGVVYGCTAEGTQVKHIRIDRLSELGRLNGSKYVQSNVCGLYVQVKDDLKKGIPVLFIGTPCQISGLKNFIGSIPEHLYLIDLICHGVPSQKMFDDHIRHIFKDKTVKYVSFRNGEKYQLKLQTNEEVYVKPYVKDLYYRGFFYGITFRESCYNCKFASIQRCGDLTIGDFWGLKSKDDMLVKPQNGISVLLPNTERGSKLLSSVVDDFYIYERSVKEAVEGNTQLRHPYKRNFRNRLFSFLYSCFFSFDMAVFLSVIDQKAMALVKRCLRIL
ncbi:Coenzyme F420 hydrogenase/dehydrogenase, beta subunit C-terminal domain [Bacteroides caecigallinarum]|uniref:Coenzyme F420 hydrogenase/dehydrogenase, beta subunit C-terminal domain n=1 Tax=Bacteroides caecigallinarum TaxID=1411144 RepID=UPI001F3A8419|nr:Coenzyme F420 hydrogenase/dehydrogenase, beta subunit C-terminal domain [Bacteroides caecigallinarum]MCF2582432.1 Coenzyme F420 hydrogenase/dehydrogenase, beta subunit C-terminal domain [Bacteroides caecigallinarum]